MTRVGTYPKPFALLVQAQELQVFLLLALA